MKIVRFLIKVDAAAAGWQVTVTSEAADPNWSISRAIRKKPYQEKEFPFPPAEEMAEAKAEAAICDDQELGALAEMYERIVKRQPLPGPPSDIETFGRYLFQVLFGNVAWKSILETADAAQADSIELALSWAATDRDLHRLNWEMMHGPDGFLARGRRDGDRVIPIGIVRMVQGSTAQPRPLSLPPRLLFVVYSDVADERIRPAAEIMGLIERLERDGRGFHREVLRNASAKLLRAKVKAFQPDLVHFICHGETDRAGKGYLLLKDEKQERDEPAYADQLVALITAKDLITGEDKIPPIVVLSACKSGGGDDRTVLGAHAVAPLAAELVQRGVPVVVGMAGRIADRACRLFTLGFGTGLLSGTPLLAAITAGRCASFAEGAPPHKNADWAFPAVFLSPQVPADYIAAKTGEADAARRLSGWLQSLKLTANPVFCARDEFFDSYDALLGPNEQAKRPAVLAVHVEKNLPGYGRKRLLQELAGQALRDGHLPLLLTNERPDGTFPQRALELAVEIIGAADNVCKNLNIPPIDSPQVLLLKRGETDAAALLQEPKLDPWVKRKIEPKDPIPIPDSAVKLALQADLTQLAKIFRDTYPPPEGRPARVVVLINRIELLGEALTTWLLTEWADAAGLGTPQEFVPLILTFALKTEADHIFNKWIADVGSRPWIIERPLKPFAPGENILAFQRVFMNPFSDLLPGVSDKALAINDEAPAAIAAIYEDLFRLEGEGMPSAFLRPKTFAIAALALKSKYLVPMEDAKWFEEIFARR